MSSVAFRFSRSAARASLCGTGALLAEIPSSLFLLLRSFKHQPSTAPFRIQAKRCRRLLLSLNRIRDWREKHEQRKIVECWPAIEPPCLKSVHHRIEL